jgi:L-cysteine:1D-myo-inositol 2-amino-2-deoxy-alpha-D-glucopyranoside ligase
VNLYNTQTQQIEKFEPRDSLVSLYVCGITPYDTTHVGHAFTYASMDVLVRYLDYLGHTVRYVQNVTDIDDDILRKAGEVGENWQALGNRWTAHFINDMKALNMRPPDYLPRATDVIAEIIHAVQELFDAGVAYAAGGSVYYDINACPDYGKLSHLSREEMLPISRERGNNPDDPNKRSPLDFVLWQAQTPGEPAWDSPWGPGRPGWHIECSTLATHYLGDTIDIHGGGSDLVYPHHESEIAQAEPVTQQKPFVRVWMHTAMVRYQGEKMSKSLGNLVMVKDLLKTWSPDALRVYLAGHHYRRAWEHDESELQQADRLARKLRAAATAVSGDGAVIDATDLQRNFRQAMDRDLDTVAGLSVLDNLAERIPAGVPSGENLESAQATLRSMASIFGLQLDADEPEALVVTGWDSHLQRFRQPATA